MKIRALLLVSLVLPVVACAHGASTKPSEITVLPHDPETRVIYPLALKIGEGTRSDQEFILYTDDGSTLTPAEIEKATKIVIACVERPKATSMSEDDKIGLCASGGEMGANTIGQLFHGIIEQLLGRARVKGVPHAVVQWGNVVGPGG